VIADVGSHERLRQVFERYRPTVVFHAAAYKHVPMMEANPLESVRNNVLASQRLFEAEVESGARVVYASSSSVYGEAERFHCIVRALGPDHAGDDRSDRHEDQRVFAKGVGTALVVCP
jgi:nucleoside-diphosphate-sugar epimerase